MNRTAIQIGADQHRSGDDPLAALAARHPVLAGHCERVRAALRRGDRATAAEIMDQIEIAARAFDGPAPEDIV